MMLDIQAEIDTCITEEESHTMLLMAAGLHMHHFGKVPKTRQLSRIFFACTYTLSAATMRRGRSAIHRNYSNTSHEPIRQLGQLG
jgi:hypothetical protein